MDQSYKPDGFESITPYLTVNGAGALIDFLQAAFDAELLDCHKGEDGLVHHASLRIGSSMVEVSDARDPWPAMPAAMHLYVPDADAVYERAIAAGGESLHPMTDMDYGERSGALRDCAGNNWYIATRQSN